MEHGASNGKFLGFCHSHHRYVTLTLLQVRYVTVRLYEVKAPKLEANIAMAIFIAIIIYLFAL